MSAIEILRVIHFDCVKSILAVVEYPGVADRVIMPVRPIIADALRLGTSGLLLSHNHPSGDPTPSRNDVAATHQLASAAEALGIRVHDHLIFGAAHHVSFRAVGYL